MSASLSKVSESSEDAGLILGIQTCDTVLGADTSRSSEEPVCSGSVGPLHEAVGMRLGRRANVVNFAKKLGARVHLVLHWVQLACEPRPGGTHQTLSCDESVLLDCHQEDGAP